jgi:hypothetical protein
VKTILDVKTLIERIDPVSRFTLRRMGAMLLMIFWLSLWAGDDAPLAALALISAAVSAAIAVLARERFRADHLNRWDEAAAYLGLHYLALI